MDLANDHRSASNVSVKERAPSCSVNRPVIDASTHAGTMESEIT
jgi:hypothetical protein